jgi:hypothetical protein
MKKMGKFVFIDLPIKIEPSSPLHGTDSRPQMINQNLGENWRDKIEKFLSFLLNFTPDLRIFLPLVKMEKISTSSCLPRSSQIFSVSDNSADNRFLGRLNKGTSSAVNELDKQFHSMLCRSVES